MGFRYAAWEGEEDTADEHTLRAAAMPALNWSVSGRYGSTEAPRAATPTSAPPPARGWDAHATSAPMPPMEEERTEVLRTLSDQATALHDMRVLASSGTRLANLPTEIELTETGARPVLLVYTGPERIRPLVSLGLFLLLSVLALPPLAYLGSLVLW